MRRLALAAELYRGPIAERYRSKLTQSCNCFDAGGCSTEQTPDDLTSRIALLGNKHNARMRPALTHPIPMKLYEVAHVRREKQTALACRKAQLSIVTVGIHPRLERRQNVEATGSQCPNKLVPRQILIEIKRYHVGSGRLPEDTQPFSYARVSASISASISALLA